MREIIRDMFFFLKICMPNGCFLGRKTAKSSQFWQFARRSVFWTYFYLKKIAHPVNGNKF